jgi:RNA polymerase sigma factor for flagellar operon FliA
MSALTPGKFSPEDRERLILEHLPQVRWIARRVYENIHRRVELDDLISIGTMGLISAIDRFDPARRLQLKTYAEYKIRGAILDTLRSLDGLSRDGRRRNKKAEAARNDLERRLQRTATHAEVADEMGLSPREYAETLAVPGAEPPISLDAGVKGTEGARRFSEILPDSVAASPEQELAESELQNFVSNAIDALEAKPKSVITLHYAHGLTMRAIAPMLSMSEWQVQETRRQAVGELKSRLAQMHAHALPVANRARSRAQ